MTTFALPIRYSYVPSWNTWHCVRELIQNAKDQEDSSGIPMSVTVQDAGDTIVIANPGANMDKSALLLGMTEKAHNASLRGQFGEGLNLALLAGVRDGLTLTIYTPDEIWRADLKPCAEFGGETCLVIKSRKRRVHGDGVQVTVTGLKERGYTWDTLKKRFLFLDDTAKENAVTVPHEGTIFLDEERRGHIYAKGIYVQTLPNYRFGYDLEHVELDRDRNMVNHWDLRYRISNLFSKALTKETDQLAEVTYRLLQEPEVEDFHSLSSYITDDVARRMLELFQAEHGDNAYPVRDLEKSRLVALADKKGVVVNANVLMEILQKVITPLEQVISLACRAVAKTYAWVELSSLERRNLLTSASIVQKTGVLSEESPLSCIEVVDFAYDTIEGSCVLDTGQIQISRAALATEHKCMEVLVHELAHRITRAPDNDAIHTHKIEELWSRAWAVARS